MAPVRPGESADPPDGLDPGDWEDDDEPTPRVRPSWWRWMAIAVIIAMVVAGPFAFALYKLLT
jgi:hypothetical protein